MYQDIHAKKYFGFVYSTGCNYFCGKFLYFDGLVINY